MSGVNCDVSDETLQYCKEFLKKYPEATNWDKSCVEGLMISFLINKTRIILLLTRITSFHVYVLERYGICMIPAIPALRVTSNHADVISL